MRSWRLASRAVAVYRATQTTGSALRPLPSTVLPSQVCHQLATVLLITWRQSISSFSSGQQLESLFCWFFIGFAFSCISAVPELNHITSHHTPRNSKSRAAFDPRLVMDLVVLFPLYWDMLLLDSTLECFSLAVSDVVVSEQDTTSWFLTRGESNLSP
jgi:hypothetical protein